MTTHTLLAAALAGLLGACTTESDPGIGTPVVDRPATGPGPAEIAQATPDEAVEQGTERLPFDQVFLNAMIQHHKRGADAAEIAVERAEHPELRAMAQHMLTSGDAQIEKMKELRETWYGNPGVPAALLPDDETAEMPGTDATKALADTLDELKDANPFDRAFLDAMIAHHEGAVEMASNASSEAKQNETIALALIIARDETAALEQMRAWRDAWYPTAQAMSEPTEP